MTTSGICSLMNKLKGVNYRKDIFAIILGVLTGTIIGFAIAGLIWWAVGAFIVWALGLGIIWTFWHGVATAIILNVIRGIFTMTIKKGD